MIELYRNSVTMLYFIIIIGIFLPPTISGLGNQNTQKYIVKKKDTLYSISKKFQVPLETILGTDGKIKTGNLFPGETLLLGKGIETSGKKIRMKKPAGNLQKIVKSFSSSTIYPFKGVLISGKREINPAAKGKAVLIDYMDGYGNFIILRHENEYISVYGNLKDIFIQEGAIVKPGEKMGNLMANKNLYFQLHHREKLIDPGTYFD